MMVFLSNDDKDVEPLGCRQPVPGAHGSADRQRSLLVAPSSDGWRRPRSSRSPCVVVPALVWLFSDPAPDPLRPSTLPDPCAFLYDRVRYAPGQPALRVDTMRASGMASSESLARVCFVRCDSRSVSSALKISSNIIAIISGVLFVCTIIVLGTQAKSGFNATCRASHLLPAAPVSEIEKQPKRCL